MAKISHEFSCVDREVRAGNSYQEIFLNCEHQKCRKMAYRSGHKQTSCCCYNSWRTNSRGYICTGTLKLSSRPPLLRPAASAAVVLVTTAVLRAAVQYYSHTVFLQDLKPIAALPWIERTPPRKRPQSQWRPTDREQKLWPFEVLLLRNIEAAAPLALCTIFTILLTFFGKSCNAHMLHQIYFLMKFQHP